MKKAKRAAPPQKPPPKQPEAAPAPALPAAPHDEGLVVIGIGASAGGLEALQQFLSATPRDMGVAFVYVQHLDPLHKSALPDILKATTSMPVVEAEDQMILEPNHIYINPPDRDVAVIQGRLHLVETGELHGFRLPIDFFLRSLARDQGDKAIGVILSGMGSDGTLGIRAIKEAGGLALAQDPKSARYDAMPRSAIATQLVDLVASPREMPRLLIDYVHHPYVKAPAGVAPTTAGHMEQLFFLLRQQTGHDFTHYKQNTIRRRVERRLAVHRMKRLEDYVRYLQHSPAEVDALFKELLIGVTNFFRDPDAFKALGDKAIPQIFSASSGNGQLRAWVPGCSTGEEAFSLAMLIGEQLEASKLNRKVTIFATDIDPGTIDAARTGLYPDNIAADVPAGLLDRFFTKENGSYRIAKRIREMVIFAVQDVLKDPPFSKLDLISCRNLLIYLGPELQQKLMQLFHAVLDPGGFLFLGTSETVGEAGELFVPIDKKWKIYEKKPIPTHPLAGARPLPVLDEVPFGRRVVSEVAYETLRVPGVGELTERILLDSYAPTSVVVDQRYDVVYTHGRTARYLELPTGEPQLNILRMARDDLLRELRTSLHRAIKERNEVVRDRVLVEEENGVRTFVRLHVKPFPGPRLGQPLLLVTFEDVSTAAPSGEGGAQGAPAPDPHVAELERELASMRESLQSTVEEVETSNEELRSTNEELQSANEELQSTNEELETSKEELQSVNEELMTVNAELQKKLEELSQANNDLTNLLNSTQIGTIFLDSELRIKRFTPAITRLINLIPSDIGRQVVDIVSQIQGSDLAAHAREVLRTLVFHESEVQTRDGLWYLQRILPYRTLENVIDGVVVTFVNVSEVREARRLIEGMLKFANNVVNDIRQPLVMLNKDGRVVQANQAFYAALRAKREDVLGTRLTDMNSGRWSPPGFRESLDAVLAGGPPIEGLVLDLDVAETGRRTLRLTARRTEFGTRAIAGEGEITVLTWDDVTGGRA